MKKKLSVILFPCIITIAALWGTATALPMRYTFEGNLDEDPTESDWVSGDPVKFVSDTDLPMCDYDPSVDSGPHVDFHQLAVSVIELSIGDDYYGSYFKEAKTYHVKGDTEFVFTEDGVFELLFRTCGISYYPWEVGTQMPFCAKEWDPSTSAWSSYDIATCFLELKSIQPTDPVPEPPTLLLLGSGLIGILIDRKRKNT